MKVYNVFNSSADLLGSYTDVAELERFIKRHKRDTVDTTILSCVANSWNEVNDVEDVTKEVMDSIWK